MILKKRKSQTIVNQYYNRRLPLKMKFYKITQKIILGFILASIVNFIFSYFFHTPKLFSFNNRNLELISEIEQLQLDINNASLYLNEIKMRDENIYRTILGIDSITTPQIGRLIANNDRFKKSRYNKLIEHTTNSLNALSQDVFHSSYYLDTIQILSLDKDKMLESIPAIWPIDIKALTKEVGRFGMRFHPVYGRYIMHNGIDLISPKGTPIYATASGTVTKLGFVSGYGKTIDIDHGYGYVTRYAHMSEYEVERGDTVVRGALIGRVGRTGVTTGNHLHYEVIHNDRHVNPFTFLGNELQDEEFYNIINSAKEADYNDI